MLIELALGKPGGEVGTVDGNIELLEQVRQRAEVVLVPVGEHYRSDVVAILFKKIEVGNANVNAVGGFFRKTHARIENKHLIFIAHGHAIHPKLANTPERDNL